MGINRIRLANGATGDPRIDARMQQTYQQNIADNQAQEAINQQNLNVGRERSRNRMQNMNRTGGLDDIGANVDVSGTPQTSQLSLLDRVGYTQHMDEDRMLKDANIDNQLMNRMGGLNVTQANPAFGLQNPFGPGIGMTMLGGA